MTDTVRTVFMVPGGKGHILIPDYDRKRFPLGRAKCAPFDRRPGDALVEPNQLSTKEVCRMCFK